MKSNIFKNEWGFTTVEIVLVIQLISLVFGLAMGMYLFYNTIYRRWADRNAMDHTAGTDMGHLAKKLRNAKDFKIGGDGRLEVKDATGREYIYRIRDGKFYRNEIPLTPEKVTVRDMKVDFGGMDRRMDLNLDGKVAFEEMDKNRNGVLETDEARYARTVNVELAYVCGKDSLTLRECVYLRNLGN